jgi:hypothetical protein
MLEVQISSTELFGFAASVAYLGLGRGGSILVFAGLLDGLGKGSSLRGGRIGAVDGLSAGSTLVRIGANVGCLWITRVSYVFGSGGEVNMCI